MADHKFLYYIGHWKLVFQAKFLITLLLADHVYVFRELIDFATRTRLRHLIF